MSSRAPLPPFPDLFRLEETGQGFSTMPLIWGLSDAFLMPGLELWVQPEGAGGRAVSGWGGLADEHSTEDWPSGRHHACPGAPYGEYFDVGGRGKRGGVKTLLGAAGEGSQRVFPPPSPR